MSEEPQAVREVREWRQKVQESWQGKSSEDILRELEATRQRVLSNRRDAQPKPDEAESKTSG